MAAKVDPEKCLGCGACTEACPVSAISIVDGKAVVKTDDCVDCGSCVSTCPAEAITQE